MTIKDIWQRGLDTLRLAKRQTLIIAVFGLLLPQVVFGLFLDVCGAQTATALREIYLQTPDGARGYAALIGPAMGYASRLVAALIAILGVTLIAYFALVHLAVAVQRKSEIPSAWSALRSAMRSLPKALVLPAVLFMIAFVGQVLVAPAILVAIMCLNLPVILVAERLSPWRSLTTALTLRYAKKPSYGGWTVLLSLISLGALAYLSLVAMSFVIEAILYGDRFLPVGRDLWSWALPGLPFGATYASASLVEAALLTTILCLMPMLTTALYFSVTEKRELAQA